MLAITLRIGGAALQPVRVASGAWIGACCAWAVRFGGLSPGHRALLWTPVAFAMVAAAAGRAALRRPLRWTGLLLCSAGLLGGTLQALAGAAGSLAAAYALGIPACAWAVWCAVRLHTAGRDRQRIAAQVCIRYKGKTAVLDAIIDSGNSLRDYLTHRSVIVLPDGAREALGLCDVPLRPIFADTAGGRQMMDCFVPEETALIIEGKTMRVLAAAAFSPGLREGAPALVPSALACEQNMD